MKANLVPMAKGGKTMVLRRMGNPALPVWRFDGPGTCQTGTCGKNFGRPRDQRPGRSRFEADLKESPWLRPRLSARPRNTDHLDRCEALDDRQRVSASGGVVFMSNRLELLEQSVRALKRAHLASQPLRFLFFLGKH